MGIHPLPDPGPHGHNCCPVHPSEPISGLCGCGTLFCRKCSPSTVFCARCHAQHEAIARSRGQSAAIIAPKWPALNSNRYGAVSARPHERPLSHRVVIEALMLTILTVVIFAMIFQMQNRAFSFSSSAEISSFGINAGAEPVQKLTDPFQTSLMVNDGEAILSSDASYSISAKVESAKAYDDSISSAIPYDLLLSWGQMATSDVDSKLTWEQGNRQGSVSGALGGSNGANVSTSYVINHVSNNHLIPANDRIREALSTIRPGDLIKIDGRLVDVRLHTDDSRVLSVSSSKTRTDQGDGACEVIFVEHLKINEKSFR